MKADGTVVAWGDNSFAAIAAGAWHNLAIVKPKENQTINFAALSNKTFGDAPFTVSATASSGLPVTFSIASGPATIAGNTVTITGAGTVTVRASQAGDNNVSASATWIKRSQWPRRTRQSRLAR